MSTRNISPHHSEIDQKSSMVIWSNQSESKVQITLEQTSLKRIQNIRFLLLFIGSLYTKKLVFAFRMVRFKPVRTITLKKRLVQVFLAFVRRSEYNKKMYGFQSIKRFFIKEKSQEIKQLNNVLLKAKISVIKILSIVLKNKERTNIREGFRRITLVAKQRWIMSIQKYRKGFQLWIKVNNQVKRRYFNKLRSSRYLVERRFKVKTIVKVINQYRQRSLKLVMMKLRRNLYNEKANSIRSQISQVENRMQKDAEHELRDIRQKQQKLQQSLIEVKRQKQSINQMYQTQIKQAETNNIQIQTKIKNIKQQKSSLIKQISQFNNKLKQNLTQDEIYKLFYNNFLQYLTKHKNYPLIKSQMLEALTQPLIPVDVPLNSLREENKLMRELLTEYVIMFGQKSLQGQELQIPYEHLVKENQVMYRILLTLLPSLQYNKKQVTQLRQTLDSIESIKKKFRM